MNLPEGFAERMRGLLQGEYDAFEKALLSEKSAGLRVNRLKRRAGTEAFLRSRFSLKEVPWCANGFFYQEEERPGKCALHEAGAYYIQEPSAMSAAELLFADRPYRETETRVLGGCLPCKEENLARQSEADEKALRVLDLCAAPGGKSTQIASHMQGKGLLWSNEIHPSRAKILSQNLERMGAVNVIVSCEEPEALAARLPGFFDRVLVDAPCSGEGMFRKSEEAINGWSLENIRLCAARQKEILRAADRLLAPGGFLVYSTCTFAPEEDEQTAEWLMDTFGYELLDLRKIPVPGRSGAFGDFFAEGFPEAALFQDGEEDAPEHRLFQKAGDRSAELCKCFRLFPHRLSGEGHFVAVFQKPGSVPGEEKAFLRGNDLISAKEGDPFAGNGKNRKELQGGKAKEDLRAAKKPRGKDVRTDLIRFLSEEIFREEAKKPLSLQAQDPVNGQQAEELPEHFWPVADPVLDRLLPFGDTWYLLPKEAPDLAGLRILRPGLELAVKKGDRFEPSHALALALGETDVCHFVTLSESDPRSSAFFRGEGFLFEGEKGWYLICIEGYSAGWGKCDGRQMKNHLPKGLRKEV